MYKALRRSEAPKKTPRKSWLSSSTWTAVRMVQAAKRKVSQARSSQLRQYLKVFCLQWLAMRPPFIKLHHVLDLHASAFDLSIANCCVAVTSYVFNNSKHEAKRMIRQDKLTHIDSVFHNGAKAVELGDLRCLFRAASSFAKYQSAKSTFVYDSNGSITCTAAEYGKCLLCPFSQRF